MTAVSCPMCKAMAIELSGDGLEALCQKHLEAFANSFLAMEDEIRQGAIEHLGQEEADRRFAEIDAQLEAEEAAGLIEDAAAEAAEQEAKKRGETS